MNVLYEPKAQNDLMFWAETDKRVLIKILNLIKEVTRTPFDGSGQPEALKHGLSGFWSRRIDKEHRLVYAVTDDTILIASCRGHYTEL